MSELQIYTRPAVLERLKEVTHPTYLPMKSGWMGDALTMLEDQRLAIPPRTRIAWALIFMPPALALEACCMLVRKTPLRDGTSTVWDLLHPDSQINVETAERFQRMEDGVSYTTCFTAELQAHKRLTALRKELGAEVSWDDSKDDARATAALAAWVAPDADYHVADYAAKAAAKAAASEISEEYGEAFRLTTLAQIELLRQFLAPYCTIGQCPSLKLVPPETVMRCTHPAGHVGDCLYENQFQLLGPISEVTSPLAIWYEVDQYLVDGDDTIQPVLLVRESPAEFVIAVRFKGRIEMRRYDKDDESDDAVDFFPTLARAVAYVKDEYDRQAKQAQAALDVIEAMRQPFYQAFRLGG